MPDAAFGARVQALMKALGYKRRTEDFAASVGVKREHVYALISGKNKPSDTLIVALCCVHRINRDWLERGEGPMFAEKEGSGGDFSAVPLVNVRLAAGAGSEVYHEGQLAELHFRTTWLRRELRAGVRNLVAMYVEGESMEPTLHAGDVVLVDRAQTDPTRQGIYALRRDNALLIKRTRLEGDRVILVSDNPAVPPEVYPWPAPIHAAQVIGRVVWAGKRF